MDRLSKRDRDTDALEAAMAQLDDEEREASEEKVDDGVPADVAMRYVNDLDGTWASADGGQGRKMLAEALFERIEVRGFREVRLHLTDAAIANGFGAVLPERLAISISGRGERARAYTPSPSLVIPVTNVPSYAHRDWKTAYGGGVGGRVRPRRSHRGAHCHHRRRSRRHRAAARGAPVLRGVRRWRPRTGAGR